MKRATLFLEELNKLGHEAYFVGGSVRDYLLKRDSFDIDIATSATPDFLMANFKAVPIGLKFGTVLILYKGSRFEVTTFRKDLNYYDNRHPEGVIFSKSINEDVLRRDFTINGLYMTKDLEVIDLIDGIKDLDNKLIKTIGNPDERFREDALRMLRAFYLVSKLEFSLDKNTFLSIHKNKELLKNISAERIYRELDKIATHQNSLEAFSLLHDSGISKYLPGLEKGIKYFVNNDIKIQKEIFFPFCFYLNGKVDKFWKLSKLNETHYQNVIKILKLEKISQINLVKFHREDVMVASRINEILQIFPLNYQEIIKLYDEIPLKDIQELAISVDELLKIYNKNPGPWIKDIQNNLLNAIIKKKINNNHLEIIDYLEKRKDNDE